MLDFSFWAQSWVEKSDTPEQRVANRWGLSSKKQFYYGVLISTSIAWPVYPTPAKLPPPEIDGFQTGLSASDTCPLIGMHHSPPEAALEIVGLHSFDSIGELIILLMEEILNNHLG